jgi:hypothetical protein
MGPIRPGPPRSLTRVIIAGVGGGCPARTTATRTTRSKGRSRTPRRPRAQGEATTTRSTPSSRRYPGPQATTTLRVRGRAARRRTAERSSIPTRDAHAGVYNPSSRGDPAPGDPGHSSGSRGEDGCSCPRTSMWARPSTPPRQGRSGSSARGGYFATRGEWIRFGRRWRRVLRDNDLNALNRLLGGGGPFSCLLPRPTLGHLPRLRYGRTRVARPGMSLLPSPQLRPPSASPAVARLRFIRSPVSQQAQPLRDHVHEISRRR